jgi:glycosyltransferase involved in cell wall biosynthesis
MTDSNPSCHSEELPNFSVVLSTYKRDTPSELAQAIESIAAQTIPPTELVIIKDGTLTGELESIIEEQKSEFPSSIQVHQIEENKGLGNALKVGVEKCSYKIIARMDADDISVPTRFEQQLRFMSNNPEVDIVGGYIQEFESDPENHIGKREVPTTHKEIEKMARFRSPMNHVTVMFKRQSVLEAGNYRSVSPFEDYDLWIRMLLDGAKFANIPETLVKVRAGEEMYERRGGLSYAKTEMLTQLRFYRQGFTSFPVFIFNTLTRTTLRLIPNRIRGAIYQLVARD